MNTVLRYDWRKLVSGATNTTAFATDGSAPVPVATEPTGAAGSQAVGVQDFPGVRFAFGGVGTANGEVNYRIILWEPSASGWYPTVTASGVFTLSAMAETLGDLDTAEALLADTITESLGKNGVAVISPANNSMASITVFPGSATHITVETKLSFDVTSASVYWAPVTQGEAASILANIEANLGNVGLLNSAETEINPATEDSLADAVTALQILDDWDESDRAKVNVIAGQVGVAGGAGAVAATVPRVTLATDDTQFGELGDAADPDGNVHGQLRTIAEHPKGLVVPKADMTVDAGADTFETGIAITAAAKAVRVFVDAAMYCVVNVTEGNPATSGPPVPADRLIDIPCLGCTWLHVAQVAGNVDLKYAYVF